MFDKVDRLIMLRKFCFKIDFSTFSRFALKE